MGILFTITIGILFTIVLGIQFTISIGPTTYTVTVISAHPWCYGTVYVAGAPTNAYLLPWGSATVYNVASGAAIYLIDTSGFQSHTEYFSPSSGTTIVFNYWW